MRRRWRLLGEAILAIALFLVAQSVFVRASGRVPFDGDEGRYIANGRYFGYLFLERDIGRPEWGDNYWTHTQPMLPRYIVGGWLWARGYALDELPEPYLWQKSLKENARQGRVPDEALLAEARAPMVLLTAASVVVLYALGSVLGGPIAGLVAAGLFIASPLAQEDLVRARSESPLNFFLLLALLVGVMGARRGRLGELRSGWAVGLGIILGLGLATKLTALLSLVALGAWVGVVALTARTPGASASASRDPLRAARTVKGWALALVVALGVAVLSNPHLYDNPVTHTIHLLEQRAEEMAEQQRDVEHRALDDWQEQGRYVFRYTFVNYAYRPARIPLEAILAAVGFVALIVRTWLGWRGTGRVPIEGLVLLTVLAYFLGISAGINMAWQRYLAPTVLLRTLLAGVGVAAVVGLLIALVGAVHTRAAALRRTAGQGLGNQAEGLQSRPQTS
jgi:4-amino-4-deoxy-L-arabinose transferase-like glycosyltransferase